MLNGVPEEGPRGMIADALRMSGVPRSAARMRLFFDVMQMCGVRTRFNEGDPSTVRRRVMALAMALTNAIAERDDAGVAFVVGTYDFNPWAYGPADDRPDEGGPDAGGPEGGPARQRPRPRSPRNEGASGGPGDRDDRQVRPRRDGDAGGPRETCAAPDCMVAPHGARAPDGL